MKALKSTGIVLIVLLFALLTVSCQSNESDGKKSIVCTIFPEYEFINNILGDKKDEFNVTLLISDGADMHSFQPTVSQIAKITDCQLFCYIGGGSQGWINNIMKNINKEKVQTLSMADALANRLSNYADPDHDHDHENEDEHPADEHLWLSLRLAKKSVEAICEKICQIDPDNSDYYKKQADEYIQKLDVLDRDFEEAVSSAHHDTVIVADRFPFVYLFKDYSIHYHAAFEGCSQESDAGVSTILSLAGKLNSLALDHIIVTEGNDGTIAEAIIRESGRNAEILAVNSCQTITKKQIEDGANYIDIMKSNLEVLKKALGCN